MALRHQSDVVEPVARCVVEPSLGVLKSAVEDRYLGCRANFDDLGTRFSTTPRLEAPRFMVDEQATNEI